MWGKEGKKDDKWTGLLSEDEIKTLAPWKSYDKPRQCIKKQRHHFTDKGLCNQSYGFSSSHVWMCELDHKEGWTLKNGCFWTVVLKNTLESPFDYKEIKPVNLKGNQPWIFPRRSDAETPIIWPPDVKRWFIGKDLDAGKDWGKKENGMTEDEMNGGHHRVNGHESEQTPGDGEGQRSLVCCSPWNYQELDMTERLNNKFRTGI